MTVTAIPDETTADLTRVEQQPAINDPHAPEAAAAVPTAAGAEIGDALTPVDADTGTGPDDEPVGELLRVDPCTLVIGANVRRDVALDKPFLRSIADRGVREPIIARRGTDGALVVRKGKRRTLAAVETGRATVPVLVELGEPGDDADAGDRRDAIDRIVDQLEENHHRAGTNEAARSGIASDASFDRNPRTLVGDPPWPGGALMALGFCRQITPGTWRPSSMLG
ncbi:hypothetical protein ACVGOW_06765 [Pseudonocardia saturnea]